MNAENNTRAEDDQTKIYIGDLSPGVNANILLHICSPYGKVKSIKVRTSRDGAKNPNRNAIVTYWEPESAKLAIHELNSTLLGDYPLRAMWYKRKRSDIHTEGGNIIILNLDKTIKQSDLYLTLIEAGDIESCKIAKDDSGNSLGYAYVSYKDPEVADRVVQVLNGTKLGEKKITVRRHVRRADRSFSDQPLRYRNCYVKKFGPKVTDKDLENMFKKFGEIKSAVVMKENKKSKGFGFVCFKDPESAAAAVQEMHGKEVDGSKLYVARAMKKSERRKVLYDGMGKSRHILGYYREPVVVVLRLDGRTTENILKDFFSECGTIEKITLPRFTSGEAKGIAFIKFSSPSEVLKAIEKTDETLLGRKIYVTAKISRKERDALMNLRIKMYENMQAASKSQPQEIYYNCPFFAYRYIPPYLPQ